MRGFKVGDKVRIDPNKCTFDYIYAHSSSGRLGGIYVITGFNDSGTSCDFMGHNWHKLEWLTLVIQERLIGGELL